LKTNFEHDFILDLIGADKGLNEEVLGKKQSN